jgi:hypothetical protein
MIISEVQHIIKILEKSLPKSFIFVLDTTDRSFIYKSVDRHDCSKEVVRIDQEYGIDKLTKGLDSYTFEENNNALILKKLSANSFLGVCFMHNEYDLRVLNNAKSILMN